MSITEQLKLPEFSGSFFSLSIDIEYNCAYNIDTVKTKGGAS